MKSCRGDRIIDQARTVCSTTQSPTPGSSILRRHPIRGSSIDAADRPVVDPLSVRVYRRDRFPDPCMSPAIVHPGERRTCAESDGGDSRFRNCTAPDVNSRGCECEGEDRSLIRKREFCSLLASARNTSHFPPPARGCVPPVACEALSANESRARFADAVLLLPARLR